MENTAFQENLIFALDIGTRSIIGMVGRLEGERVNVLAVEKAEHAGRAMVDGQIENIDKVAGLAGEVKKRLEKQLDLELRRVSIAAAGRALRTQRVTYEIELPDVQLITEETISRLEAGAISAAEAEFAGESGEEQAQRRFYLVGYSVCQYYLDDYMMSSLKDHHGRHIRADIIATFLPGEVVESLYTTMHKIDLEVASITLEPIAAINAAIPESLRLLNLALADVGAGTSDIAACRDGSVIGYTMATIAGDEVTEAIMKEYLVDFQTAEMIKAQLDERGDIVFTDVLGFEQKISYDDVMECVGQTTEKLCAEIAAKIKEVNGGVPSAVFLSGGGSRLKGLREGVINALEMNPGRVAIAGNNFQIHAFSEGFDINNPEYATPIGILVSSGLNLINDSFQITLNGRPAKLFRSGAFSARDLLMMNGYSYQDMIGRSGKNIVVSVNGERTVFYGTHAEPAVLKINGREGKLSDTIHAGDEITFTPAVNGATPEAALKDIKGISSAKRVRLNGESVALSTPLKFGDVITFVQPGTAEEILDDEDAEAYVAIEGTGMQDSLPEPPMEREAPANAETPVNAEMPANAEAPANVVAPIKAEAPVNAGVHANNAEAPTNAEAPEPANAGVPVNAEAPANAEAPVNNAVAPTNAEAQVNAVAPVSAEAPRSVAPAPAPLPSVTFMLNDKPLTLMRRGKDNPYLLMDMLEYADLDFNHLRGEVVLLVNGKNGYFQQPLREGDSISIFEREKA